MTVFEALPSAARLVAAATARRTGPGPPLPTKTRSAPIFHPRDDPGGRSVHSQVGCRRPPRRWAATWSRPRSGWLPIIGYTRRTCGLRQERDAAPRPERFRVVGCPGRLDARKGPGGRGARRHLGSCKNLSISGARRSLTVTSLQVRSSGEFLVGDHRVRDDARSALRTAQAVTRPAGGLTRDAQGNRGRRSAIAAGRNRPHARQLAGQRSQARARILAKP